MKKRALHKSDAKESKYGQIASQTRSPQCKKEEREILTINSNYEYGGKDVGNELIPPIQLSYLTVS